MEISRRAWLRSEPPKGLSVVAAARGQLAFPRDGPPGSKKNEIGGKSVG